MKVMILGGGGREHALAWKISQSRLLTKLYVGPGNAGTRKLGTNVDIDPEDFDAIRDFVIKMGIDMVIVGPEAPLVSGIHDFFLNDDQLENTLVIGPVKQAAMLEGSKDFAKAFMTKHGIPTAGYKSFTRNNIEEGIAYLQGLKPPVVLKADGLAAGKGVLILNSIEEAEKELREMLAEDKFGKAGHKVVIEDFLKGIEVSVFVLTDGNDYVMLPNAKDYKRIGEGDTGNNTGGMGSISPVPFAGEEFMAKVMKRIIEPTVEGLQSDGISYKGFIFFGLINVEGDPFVIEYNARLGDPEAESILPRIKSDLLETLIAVGKEELAGHQLKIDPRYSAAVMAVSGGYPGSYEKGKTIDGLEGSTDGIIFHAGTAYDEKTKKVVTSGGRVLATTGLDTDLDGALAKAYKMLEEIRFENMYFRKDLGKDLRKYL